MAPKKTKQPIQQRGTLIKTPEPTQASTNDKHPVFCLQHNQRDYALLDCETDEQAAFAQQLARLSKFTWGEITLMKHQQYGYEHIPSDQLKPNLPGSVDRVVDQYMVFRFQNGDARMIGYRKEHVYHILWVDPKLTAYDH